MNWSDLFPHGFTACLLSVPVNGLKLHSYNDCHSLYALFMSFLYILCASCTLPAFFTLLPLTGWNQSQVRPVSASEYVSVMSNLILLVMWQVCVLLPGDRRTHLDGTAVDFLSPVASDKTWAVAVKSPPQCKVTDKSLVNSGTTSELVSE